MKTIKTVIIKTRPEEWREVEKNGKETIQQVCNQWIELFITYIHTEQNNKPRRKIYADDVHAAFSTFVLRGVKDDTRK